MKSGMWQIWTYLESRIANFQINNQKPGLGVFDSCEYLPDRGSWMHFGCIIWNVRLCMFQTWPNVGKSWEILASAASLLPNK